MLTHVHNSFFKSIEFFRFFMGILYPLLGLLLASTVASAESRSFAFWRGVDVIDASKEQAQEYELVLKKLSGVSETTLYSFNHFAMLADAGINSKTAQLTFGRIQASPDGSEIIIGYGVKEPADNVKLARIEKLSLTDGTRSTIKEWNVNSPAGSFNYDFEPLTVDWTNQKIYFFDTNETNKSVDSLVFLPFSGGEVKLIQEIHGSPETIQLDPQNQDVMVMGEDGFEHGVIYIYDKSGIFSIIKRTDTVPDEHTFSFSASGDEFLYLNAPDGGNPSLKSKSISNDSETILFEYTYPLAGSWDPLKSDNDFKDIETFYNEDSSGKIAFVAESLGEYAELVELDINSGVTTILSTGVVQVPQQVDSYEDGWLVNFSGTPVPQSQPSSTSVPNASGVYTPVPTPIIPQASSLIAHAGPVSEGGHWKQSSWLGYFWEKPDSAWIFHPVLGWLHVVPNNDDSFWVYTQDLFPIPLWLWIQPNQFPYVYAKAGSSSGRRLVEMDGVTTSWSNKILSNKYIEWNLGDDWLSLLITDMPLVGRWAQPNLTFGANKSNNKIGVVLNLLYEEPLNFAGIDSYLWDSTEHKFHVSRTVQSDVVHLLAEETFLTDAGHQAFVVHTRVLPPSGNSESFTFLVDGSTVGFPQPEGTWMKASIGITTTAPSDGSLPLEALSMTDAKAIVNGLKFKGGAPKPAIELPELAGMTPGSSAGEYNPITPAKYTVPSISMEMIWCPPGTFLMGSPPSEIGRRFYVRGGDETQHKVTLTSGFFLGKFELNQAQYKTVMGDNPSFYTNNGKPVESVSWSNAISFCEKITQLEQLENRLPEGWAFTLPSEAEWEYACRAGTTSAYSWGETITTSQANFANNGLDQTVSIGSYSPNPWGFYDMHGNVWEWVYDYYSPFESGSVTDPQGPENGNARVNRGGSYVNDALDLRSAYREADWEGSIMDDVGFRVALKPISDEAANWFPGSENTSITPSTSPSTPAAPTAPNFEEGVWLYLDMENGNFTDWNDQSNTWADWSKITKPNLTGTSSTTSVTEKYQGMEFSEAVESIMDSSKTDDEKKQDLGDYILGLE